MKTRNFILYFISLLAFSSCQDMFEPAEVNNRTEDAMTEESAYAHGLLMYGYGRLPYITTTQTDIATDDAVTNQLTNGYRNMASGTWAADNNPMSRWDACKDGIQYVNLFLTKVEDTKWAPSAESKNRMFIDRLKGEAYGLRALFYYHLLQAHGGYADDGILYGVPLLKEPEDASSDFNQERAKFSDCMELIFADCDSAVKYLPLDYIDIKDTMDIPADYRKLGAQVAGYNLVFGDKSKGLLSAKIAEAIKAQAALLAASPAFRDQSGVTSEQAALLCAKVLDRIGGLKDGFDNMGNIWYSSSNKVMLEPNAPEMAEILWRENRHKNADQERENFPPSVYGSGRVNPSQNLVDAFPMRNGYPITDKENSGYNENDPYVNRDPRLAQTVIYNGVTYRRSVIITGTYTNSEDNLDHDNKVSTRTGYYLSKLLRDDVNPQSSSTIEQQHIYPRIRYTELFLAYAEAANDAWGPKDDPKSVGYTAYDVIKSIRKRAGLATNEIGMPLPEGDAYLEKCASDKNLMTDLIRNERRIELCFENKRFWDMRRWMLPLDENVRGVKIDKVDPEKEDSPLKYTYFDVEDRVYDNSYQCYGPIPKSEILKWSKLKQNKGWN